jgi:hypothetical protein
MQTGEIGDVPHGFHPWASLVSGSFAKGLKSGGIISYVVTRLGRSKEGK